MTVTIEVATSTIIRRLGFILALAALLFFLLQIRTALSMFLVAGFIALAVNNPVTRLSRKMPHANRKLAAAVVFTIIGLVVVFVIALIVPVITAQGRDLAVSVPGYLDQLQAGEGFLSAWFASVDLAGSFEEFLDSVIGGLVASLDRVVALIARVLENIAIFIFTLVLAFLMSVEGPRWVESVRKLIPAKFTEPVSTLSGRMYRAVTGFVNGQLIITSIAASVTLILLTILGVPAPASLAATIWVTGLIPLIGNTLGAVIVIAVALSQSFTIALLLSVFYIVYQQIENNVLEPLVQARTIKMTPLFILISALIGVFAAGFIGALLAVPVGACVKICINYIIENYGSEAKSHHL